MYVAAVYVDAVHVDAVYVDAVYVVVLVNSEKVLIKRISGFPYWGSNPGLAD